MLQYLLTSREQTQKILNNLLESNQISRELDTLRKHPETYQHSLRVAELSIDLALENKLNPTMTEALGLAALLHDIGKLFVPEEILNKSGVLEENEKMIMHGHVRLGFLTTSENGSRLIREIIVRHHEYTTAPYPRHGEDRRGEKRKNPERRKAKPAVETMAMILALADSFDALVQKRVYKPAFNRADTERILREAFFGKAFLINQILSRYP